MIPDQIIDRTKGIRESTYFKGVGLVAHSMFGEPFSTKLNAFVTPRVQKILEGAEGSPKLHTDKTVVCMEGALSAESTANARSRFLHPCRIVDVSWTRFERADKRAGTASGAGISSTCPSSPKPSSRARQSSSEFVVCSHPGTH